MLANQALQQTIEAFANGVDLQQIVPRVLRIVAEVFRPTSCAFFENNLSDEIFLRYWNVSGRTLSPAELIQLDPEKFGLVRRLAEGFTANVDYLGIPTSATGTVVLDHVRGTSIPEFDEFAVSTGWELELNIGVGPSDRRTCTLVIYREKTNPFAPDEIALAESLAKQLGLARQFAQLADEAREAAVAREHEEAAKTRLAELAKANEVLRTTLGRFAVSSDSATFLSAILEEIVHQIGAETAQLALYDEPTHTMRTLAGYVSGQPLDFDFSPVISASELGAFDVLRSMQAPRFFDPATEAHLFWPGTVDYHRRRGTKTIYCVSMFFGSRFSGYLGFGFGHPVQLSPERIELAQALAQQATLVAELLRLSNTERSAAIALEREEAARQRAAQLAQANQALQATADALAASQKIDEMVPAVLRIISKTFGSKATGYFEFSPDGPILLRFFLVGDRVFSAEEILHHPELKRQHVPLTLVQGFTVDDQNLGEPITMRTRATVVDHQTGTSNPAFDAWTHQNGWAMELNVPLVEGGKPFAALTLAREHGQPYTELEIELAKALAKHLALAVQASRIASESENRAVAIAKASEQQASAQLRAQELVEINSQLCENLTALSEGGDSQKTLQHILSSTLRQLQSEGACLFALDESQHTLQIAASSDHTAAAEHDRLNSLARRAHPFPTSSLPLWKRLIATRDAILLDARLDEDAKWLGPDTRQWHLDQLRPVIVAVPLTVAGRLLGYMSITFGPRIRKELVSADQLRMSQSLASLAAMTIETDRLAKLAQDAAIAEDRNRLAQELHDTLAGALTGISMQLQAALDLPDSRDELRRACIGRAADLARAGLRQVREFVHSLTFIGEDRWKSVEVMRKIVLDATAGTGTAGKFVVQGTERLLKATVAHALQRILREAVGNAQRYANATRVEATLLFEEKSLQLTFSDNGDGFDVRSVSDSGFGIPGMRTRVARLSGTFSIDSEMGRGTTISLCLPEPYETAFL